MLSIVFLFVSISSTCSLFHLSQLHPLLSSIPVLIYLYQLSIICITHATSGLSCASLCLLLPPCWLICCLVSLWAPPLSPGSKPTVDVHPIITFWELYWNLPFSSNGFMENLVKMLILSFSCKVLLSWWKFCVLFGGNSRGKWFLHVYEMGFVQRKLSGG